MTDERFDKLMRDAAQSYHRPPDLPPLEEIWESIEQARQRGEPESFRAGAGKRSVLSQPWLRMAAILIVGVGLGRASVVMRPPAPQAAKPTAPPTAAAPATEVPRAYQLDTDQYLGQAAALLISLPAELNAQHANPNFARRADDLLLETRLLLDSPAASDPGMRTLFEDLEVILVQVVRLGADPDGTRIDLLNEVLEQRNLIPRLRDAVVEHIAD
jgi:hypothetical protein